VKWAPGFPNVSALRGYSDDLRQQEIQIRPELNLLSCGNTFFPSHSGVKIAVGKPSGSVIQMLCRLFERLSPTGIIVRDLIEIWPLENRRYVVDQRPYQHENGIETTLAVAGIDLLGQSDELSVIQIWVLAFAEFFQPFLRNQRDAGRGYGLIWNYRVAGDYPITIAFLCELP
jgi:hypothetical protein